MKLLLKILFIIFIIWMCVGTYFIQKEHPKAQIIMGLGVFYLSFLLMPVFIYYRYRDGKYKKYIINDEKLKEAFKGKK
jgi:quinol-cytochrome oxidoreductase complex cytochrome b subunit